MSQCVTHRLVANLSGSMRSKAMNNLHSDLDRFYCLLAKLEETGVQGKRLDSYAAHNPFPARGVYFFREVGECRASDPNTLRIVRIGTHAVSANAKSTLRSRLKAHLGTRAGGGNHRGSIFRLHVGAALLRNELAIVRERLPQHA
jgi:hypothetical protein